MVFRCIHPNIQSFYSKGLFSVREYLLNDENLDLIYLDEYDAATCSAARIKFVPKLDFTKKF